MGTVKGNEKNDMTRQHVNNTMEEKKPNIHIHVEDPDG